MRHRLLLLLLTAVLFLLPTVTNAQRFTDRLDRGLIAMKTSSGVYVSWRILGEEYYDVTYNLYRDGIKVNSEPLMVSNFKDTSGSLQSKYSVAPVVGGVEQDKCAAVSTLANDYLEIRPKHEGILSTLVPNDACCADLDGDGQLEILMKYDNLSEMEQAYPKYGPTINGTVTHEYSIFECLKLNGNRLWWVNFGPNMADFQNNEQNMVAYDWDEDGCAEVIMRAADGTVIHKADGTTYTVGNASSNVRGANGGGVNWFITTNGEYLLYLDGKTGNVLDCLPYPLPILESGETNEEAAWGDKGWGHRCSKHFFGAPYFDGRKPSIFIARGIYTRHKMIAYDVNPTTHKLIQRWKWYNNTWGPWKGQGYHNYCVADVDMDGRDEIVFGSMVIDDNGKGLSTTGLGHGDAEHVGDLNPYVHGLEIFACQEDNPGTNYRDATTSKFYYRYQGAARDVGRCMAGNFTNSYPGAVGTPVSEGMMSLVKNKPLSGVTEAGINQNMRIYWDGDLLEETFNYLNGKNTEGCVAKYGSWTPIYICSGSMTNNDTKGTPCYQGDLFGDWREEIMMRTADNNIRIYSTTIPTQWRNYTLWHDHQYRNAMVWQMCGYNQPPHCSYFLGELENITIAPPPLTMTGREEVKNGGTINSTLNGKHAIVCETNDTQATIEQGAQPSVLTFNVPTWVQGTAGSESTSGSPKINYTTYTCTVSGSGLSGNSRLVKQGDGVLKLPKAEFTHTGETNIWGGTLMFDGTMTESALWLNRHSKLITDGGRFHSIKADYGATIQIGAEGAASTLTTDTLELGFGARLTVDIWADGSQRDVIKTKVLKTERKTGTAWTQYGPEYISSVIELVGHFNEGETKMTPGKYIVLEFDSISGSVDDIKFDGIASSKKRFYIEDNKLMVEVLNMRDAGDIIWMGTVDNKWENSETLNFSVGTQQEETSFVTGDNILFNDDAQRKSVNIVGNVMPATITVAGSDSYSFTGTGSIGGKAVMTKEGTGSLTISGDHTYTGGNHLRGGTVSVKKLANSYSATGNLGGVTTNADLFTIEDGAILLATDAVEQGSPMKMVGDLGGVINHTKDFFISKAVTGTKLTKKGSGWMKLNVSNPGLSRLTVEAGAIQCLEGTNFPAKTVELRGGEIRECTGTSYNIEVAEGKTGAWYMVNDQGYSNKITGKGKLTAYCTSRAGGSGTSKWWATRTPVACNFSEFEGTLVATSSSDDANNLRFTLNTSSGMPKGTMDIGNKVVIENTAKTFRIGKITGSGRLGGNCSFSSSATSGSNTWIVGDDASWSTEVRVTSNSNFQKVGTGTITWKGNSDNTGSTQIKEGTLKLQSGGCLGTGALTVAQGATLMGVNSSSLPIKNSMITVNGTLRVGASASAISGNMFFGDKNLTISETGTLVMGINRKTTSTVNGNLIQDINRLTFNGTLSLHLASTASLEVGDSIVLWKNVKTFVGTPHLETLVIDLEKGIVWDDSDLPKGILRVVAATPEAVNGTRRDNSGEAVYNMQGHQLNEPQNGINIIRKGDGTIRKVIRRKR